MIVVRFTGIGLTYPGPPPVTALRPCDLRVHKGEYVAITGPSGSGKSTFLNIVGLLDRPTEGSYELNGTDTSQLTEAQRTELRARHIGFVFQSFHVLPYRTATENVMMAQLYQGVAAARRRESALHALDRVGLAHRLNSLPGHMSGGERQRVAIARALAANPSLLLCDEPTGNLDSATAASVLDLIEQLHAEGITVLIITHDTAVAQRARRVISIRDGNMSMRTDQ